MNKHRKFKVGDRVLLSDRGLEPYGYQNNNNSYSGTILKIDGVYAFSIEICWDGPNDYVYFYAEKHLVLESQNNYYTIEEVIQHIKQNYDT